jgi:hypothetical protein
VVWAIPLLLAAVRRRRQLFTRRKLQRRPKRWYWSGCSMGAHIVATLAERCNAIGLALVAPAAYGARAETLNFGARLTAELRRPQSWQHSPAFSGYRAFSGYKLLIAPQDDVIIPSDVTNTYVKYTDASFVWRPAGVGHRFLACATPEEKAATRESVRRIASFLELCARSTTSERPPNTEETVEA